MNFCRNNKRGRILLFSLEGFPFDSIITPAGLEKIWKLYGIEGFKGGTLWAYMELRGLRRPFNPMMPRGDYLTDRQYDFIQSATKGN